MSIEKDLKECFITAKREEFQGRKHKGLLVITKSQFEAESYIRKAKNNLEFCSFCKKGNFDYKLPEEWYYTLYYCALAILQKFGIESRSQRYTSLFLKYVKEKRLIDYDDEFINRILVYKEKEMKSDVDEREEARYSSAIKIKEVELEFEEMMNLCRKAIGQAEDIVFSNTDFQIPPELIQS